MEFGFVWLIAGGGVSLGCIIGGILVGAMIGVRKGITKEFDSLSKCHKADNHKKIWDETEVR